MNLKMVFYLHFTLNAFFTFLLLLLVIFPGSAHAYLDPGTGSYVLQLLIATVIGALFALKMFWKRVVTFFKNLVSRPPNSDN
jgi:hypothetical protein